MNLLRANIKYFLENVIVLKMNLSTVICFQNINKV